MARTNGAVQATPLQVITEFFLTEPLERAELALQVAQTVLASRSAGTGAETAATPVQVRALAPASAVDDSGRVRRGRPRRSGLPAVLAQQAGLDPVALPPQGSLEDQ